jgi:hypothetical protein
MEREAVNKHRSQNGQVLAILKTQMEQQEKAAR